MIRMPGYREGRGISGLGAVAGWLAVSLLIAAPAGAAGETASRFAIAAPPGAQGDTLSILFTGETRGNLVPCSCPSNPLGGLARRVRLLQDRAARLTRGGPVLRLDSGGFLPEGEVPLRGDRRTATRLVGLILSGFGAGELDAAALDHGERAFLQAVAPEEAARIGGVLLQADPPDPPRLFQWSGSTVAVLALEESLADSTVRRAAREARRRAEYLVILARADAFTGRRLARLSHADLVLLSRGARTESILFEGRVPMFGCGTEGKEIGEVRLLRASGVGGLRAIAGRPTERGEGASAPGLAVVSQQLHPLGPSLPEDPSLGRRVRALLLEAGADAPTLAGARE